MQGMNRVSEAQAQGCFPAFNSAQMRITNSGFSSFMLCLMVLKYLTLGIEYLIQSNSSRNVSPTLNSRHALQEIVDVGYTEGAEVENPDTALEHVQGIEGIDALASIKSVDGLEGLSSIKSVDGLEGLSSIKSLNGLDGMVSMLNGKLCSSVY